MDFELLEWDSAFFGFGVARILSPQANSLALSCTLNELRHRKVALVYWASDPEDELTQVAARAMDGYLADEKVTYLFEMSGKVRVCSNSHQYITTYGQGWPNGALEKLALQSGVYSRFRLDPHIPVEKFEELYRLWIRESVKKKLCDEVLIYCNGEHIVGMVTVGIKAGRGDIGLIAVDESARGLGVGESLVHAAREWSFEQDVAATQVVTQKANAAACRLYEKCGYQVEKVDNVYHFWL